MNKSWIVIPAEKENLINEKYKSYLKENKYIGVIIVQEGGRWEMIHRPYFRNKIYLNQALLNLMMKGY